MNIYKYTIDRKDDRYRIKSNDITFTEFGVWINDDLESNYNSMSMFIPYHNILQIAKYEE